MRLKMSELKWKDEIYAKDFLENADPSIQGLLITNTRLLAGAIGKTYEEILQYPYSTFLKLFKQFTDRYGLAEITDFLGRK